MSALEERYKLLGDIYRKQMVDREYYVNQLAQDEGTQKNLTEQAKERPTDEDIKKQLADAQQRVSDDTAKVEEKTAAVAEARKARDAFRDEHPKVAEGIDKEDRERDEVLKERQGLRKEMEAKIGQVTGHEANEIPPTGDAMSDWKMKLFAAGLAVAGAWNANAETTEAVRDGLQNNNRPAVHQTHDQATKAREQLGENATDLNEGLEKQEHKPSVPPPTEPSARQLADTKSQPPSNEPDPHWTRY